MNEPIPPTAERTTTIPRPVIPPATEAPTVDVREKKPHNPLDVTPERPKTHPVAYAALAIATLALLLSILALTQGGDDGGYRQVKVGNADCVIGPQAEAADALYCRTAGIPAS